MPSEIKPSFSFKYLFFLLITATITSGITVIIDKYQKNEKVDKIFLNVIGGSNESTEDGMSTLENDTTRIMGYFHKLITISNIGTNGLENLSCEIATKNSNIFFRPNPTVNIISKELGKIDYQINVVSSNQSNILIPLLNKGEGISIFYSAYSINQFPTMEVDVTIRKKDLEVVRTYDVIQEKEGITTFVIIFYTLFFLNVSVLLYLVVRDYLRWKKDPGLREYYNNSFWKYLGEDWISLDKFTGLE